MTEETITELVHVAYDEEFDNIKVSFTFFDNNNSFSDTFLAYISNDVISVRC